MSPVQLISPLTNTIVMLRRGFSLCREISPRNYIEIISWYKSHVSISLSRFPPSTLKFLQHSYNIALPQREFHIRVLWHKVVQRLIEFQFPWVKGFCFHNGLFS